LLRSTTALRLKASSGRCYVDATAEGLPTFGADDPLQADTVPAVLGVWRYAVAVIDPDDAARDGLTARLGGAITPARGSAVNVPMMSHVKFSSTNQFSMSPQLKRRSSAIAEVT
jgi:hypothetical protein